MPDITFSQGKQIKTTGGQTLSVTRWLGGGGQGDVYEVDVGGKPMALKWYKKSALKEADSFRKNIEKNINDGAPSDVFLWPEALTEELDGTFGYIMKLRPNEYADFSKFLKAKVRFKDSQTAIRASLKMVNAFKLLHNRGCSYQDFNDGNFFINPSTGDVLICDNDNVAEYGASFGIAGKPGYVAPEIVLGEKKPSVHTDRFSLAVMLFLTLVMSRPFEGQMTRVPCLTESHERKFFGEDPVFIFHPTDGRNRPARGLDNNALNLWPLLPDYIQDAFVKTFTDGVKDMGRNEDQRRITETQWEKLLTRLRDETVICSSCGWETVYPTDGTEPVCLNSKCAIKLSSLLLLDTKVSKIVIYPGMKIYGNHMGKIDDFDIVFGEVVVNKKNPNLWGIKNLSDLTWQELTPDGKTKAIENGNAVRALAGIKISFGNGIDAEIMK
ncbi:MAG: protein kinase [Oscillospiraceae bacterium]|nr:protein kinase [Oscillospiraceae bacterium]